MLAVAELRPSVSLWIGSPVQLCSAVLLCCGDRGSVLVQWRPVVGSVETGTQFSGDWGFGVLPERKRKCNSVAGSVAPRATLCGIRVGGVCTACGGEGGSGGEGGVHERKPAVEADTTD
jgi:hypothetical protein